MTFLCDSTDQYSCTGASVCSLGSSGTVVGTPLVLNCTAPNLEAAGAFTHYLRYSIGTAPASTGDSYSNSISTLPNEPEANNGNNTAAEPTAVRAKADLQVISKTALISSPPLQYGQAFQWQIRVDNAGPGSAVDTVLTDSMPPNMELAAPFTYSVSPGAGTCSAGGVSQFTCNLGDIAPGDVQTILVNVFLRKPSGTPPTSYTNTATATTFSVDPDPSNNSDTGTVTLVKSSLAGSVYRDNNHNGAKEGGENGISGVQVALSGHDVFNNSVSRTATTDASGNYLIDNLEQADPTATR